MAEHDVEIFNVSADEPGGTDVIVSLVGAQSLAGANAVSANESANNISVDLSGAESAAESGSLTAFGQGTPGTLGYPRVGQYHIGSVGAWAVNDPLGEDMREGIAKLDAVVLNMNPNLISDTDQGVGDYMSRQAIVNDLKARNPNILIFDYVSLQVTGNTADPGSGGLECYENSGPVGAELHWTTKDYGELSQSGSQDPSGTDLIYYASTGIPISDWWARIANGTKKSTFGTNYSVNICPAYTQPNAQGQRWPQWHFDNVSDGLRLQPHAISNGGSGYGEDGINMYFDVFRVAPKSSRFDFNGDGDADEADTYYDAHDGTHRAAAETLAGGGGVVAANWRQGFRDYFDLHRASYPQILLLGNTTSWFPDNDESEGALGYDVQPEYQLVTGTSYPTLTNNYPRDACLNGGIVENVTSGGSQSSSVTGVDSDGTITASIPGGWQRAYNKYRYLVEVCQEPKFVMLQFFIEATTQTGTTPNGRKAFSYIPHPNTPFHLHRWMLCMALMGDGYVSAAATQYGSDAGTFITAMIFDEYGTINESTTGLSRGWLGQPLEDMQVISGSGDHRLVKREFENGVAIGNTSKTNNILLDITEIDPLQSGIFKRINGVQDSTWNNGQVQTSNFVIPPRDGIVMERN